MKKNIVLNFFLMLFTSLTYAEVKYNNEFSAYIGMSMVSFAENPKTIAGENVDEPASGSVAAIAASFQYNFSSDFKKNFYITATFPLLPSPQLYLNTAYGMEYYFNDVGTKTDLYSSGTSLSITPSFRYFVGGEIGVGYLVYTTEDATKSDVLFELGPTGGMGYTFSDNWSAKAKLSILKGTGVVTSTMNITAILGVTRFLD